MYDRFAPISHLKDKLLKISESGLGIITIIGRNNSGKTALIEYWYTNIFHKNRLFFPVHQGTVDTQMNSIINEGYSKQFKEQRQRIDSDRHAQKDLVNYNGPFGVPIQPSEYDDLDDDCKKRVRDFILDAFNLELEIKAEDVTKFGPRDQSLLFSGVSLRNLGTGIANAFLIATALFHPNYKYIFLDEPERGLETLALRKLFELIKSQSLKKFIVISSHSQIFLKYQNGIKNFELKRSIEGKSDLCLLEKEHFPKVIYRSIGCRPSELGFPDWIVVVEGITDKIFLSRCYELMYPDQKLKISFEPAHSDSKVPISGKIIQQIFEIFHPLGNQNIVSLLLDGTKDKANNGRKKLKEEANKLNLGIKTLGKNAIEYYYPNKRLSELLDCEICQVEKKLEDILSNKDSKALELLNENLELNTNVKTSWKKKLVQNIISNLTKEDIHEEIKKFIEDYYEHADSFWESITTDDLS